MSVLIALWNCIDITYAVTAVRHLTVQCLPTQVILPTSSNSILLAADCPALRQNSPCQTVSELSAALSLLWNAEFVGESLRLESRYRVPVCKADLALTPTTFTRKQQRLHPFTSSTPRSSLTI